MILAIACFLHLLLVLRIKSTMLPPAEDQQFPKYSILIGTLFSGENEFSTCLESLTKQDYRNFEHFIIKNLPNKEAHDLLYRKFMSERDNFELFLKLDADMVFLNDYALRSIVKEFERDKNLDHAQFAVHDWYSDQPIMGVHVTSRNAIWQENDNKLFVDPYPRIPGKRKLYWNGIAPFIIHSPNPTSFQAYHFGLHRALKAFQYETDRFSSIQSQYQWKILKKTWKNFKKSKDKRLGFAILGAEHVITKRISHGHYDYTNDELYAVFDKFSHMNSQEIYNVLRYTWDFSINELKHIWSTIPHKLRKYITLTNISP